MSHVTVEQRYAIERMLIMKFSQISIANAIGKDKSVVSREIKRNRDLRSGEYRYDLAQRKYVSRLANKSKQVKFTNEIKDYVESKLKDKWSPEQISNSPCPQIEQKVSHERIYQHIAMDKKAGGDLYKHLRRKKKYKKRCGSPDRRGKLTGQKNIKERPKIVEKRKRVGDFEVDLVIGANHKGAIVTMNDRRTGYAILELIKSKDSKELAKTIVRKLKKYKVILRTITSDNGKEFADHKWISSKLEIGYYFADPYSSWQRGSNENYNGLLRQYFPKKTNFKTLNKKDVMFAQNQLNHRPRKRLGYKTPHVVFNLLINKVAFRI